MKPEAINQAIAESCGYKNIRYDWINGSDAIKDWLHDGGRGIPNYFGDLNSCREARKSLCQKLQNVFIRELYNLVILPAETEYDLQLDSLSVMWILVNSTSQQQAEAYLRTINKWVEEKKV